jgi:teichuronic acid biosynthesis glycosyltransferase TuaC
LPPPRLFGKTEASISGRPQPATPAKRSSKHSLLARVLLVTNLYPTAEEPWRGCWVREQAEDLAALGLDLELIHFDGRPDPMNYLRTAGEIRRRVHRESFDLVHAHYGLTGAAAVFQREVPIVTTFHGSDCNGAIPWQRYLSWAVARRSFPIFVSKEGRRMLGCSSAPIIPAGVDTELFTPLERGTARRRLGWSEDRRYVLLPSSRAILSKRADLFDAVLSEAQRAEPDLAGVALTGFSREQVALVLNAVDVVLMTSDREGSPVTVREALACETPVVSVEVGDLHDVLAGLPGCGVFSREPRALARGVLDALGAARDPVLRRRAELHSRRAVAERIVAVYSSALDGRAR